MRPPEEAVDREPRPRQVAESEDLERHRERARRYEAARADPRKVKRQADSGTGERSTAAALKKAD